MVQDDQMIVSVTGATGFIGKKLVHRLHSGIEEFHYLYARRKYHHLKRAFFKIKLIFPSFNQSVSSSLLY